MSTRAGRQVAKMLLLITYEVGEVAHHDGRPCLPMRLIFHSWFEKVHLKQRRV